MALVELNVKYTLIGPDGTTAVFNDPADPNYVGMLTEVTGMDSPDVRENAEDLVQMDGGIHGDFFYGRRPVTMTGLVLNPSSATDRNVKLDKLSQATNALRSDAILTWTPSGGSQRLLRVRRQQPLRFSGAWQKDFQISLVAADPLIYSYVLNSASVSASGAAGLGGRGYPKAYSIAYGQATPNGQLLVPVGGNVETKPLLTITGPGQNPSLVNVTNGSAIYLAYSLGDGESMVIDCKNWTFRLNGQADRYSALDFFRSTPSFSLAPGVTNDLRLAFDAYTSPASLTVQWRDAWI